MAPSSEAPSPIRALHFGPAKGAVVPEVLPGHFTRYGTGPFLEIFHSYVFENQWVAEERGIS